MLTPQTKIQSAINATHLLLFLGQLSGALQNSRLLHRRQAHVFLEFAFDIHQLIT